MAGPLVLIGGASSPAGEALGAFIRLSGAAEGAPIVGLTVASSDPAAAAIRWRADLMAAGATHVDIPVVDSRKRARDRRIAARLREAGGIFLGGGDQVKLVASLSGTPVGEAIRAAHESGCVVCGTSAGAAALTETTLAGGEVDDEGNLVEIYIGPGLGLLRFHAMIDTHFGARRRLHRLFVAIAGYPELMGLGIDEDTALVVRGQLGEVVGRGGVTFVDGRTVHFDNADDVRQGGQLTLSHLRVGIVGHGYTFDLDRRELELAARAGASRPLRASARPTPRDDAGDGAASGRTCPPDSDGGA